jgi:NADH-quinone oxidoreductase subunit N
MTTLDFNVLSPFLILAIMPVLIMLFIAYTRIHGLVVIATLFTFIFSLISIFSLNAFLPYKIGEILIIDNFALIFTALINVSGIFITIFSYYYLGKQNELKEEYYILLIISSLGASLLAASTHFISFFLSIELLSIPLYVMISYLRERDYSIEASIKYLVLAAASSAILLMGMGLLYAASGTMNVTLMGIYFNFNTINLLAYSGIVLIIAGLGFKLAIVPFHTWASDVYQGSPAPVTAFLSSISKAGAFAFLLRFMNETGFWHLGQINNILLFVAILTMFTGNILALMQNHLKRLLAFSSIAHMGYLLLAIIAGGVNGTQAGIFYIITYSIMSLGVFGVISYLSSKDNDIDFITEIDGLFYKHPIAGVALATMLLSLAGMPLTAGFIGKFLLLKSGFLSGNWLASISLVLTSIIGLYYYLRVVVVIFMKKETQTVYQLPIMASIVLSILILLIIYLGTMPHFLMSYIQG